METDMRHTARRTLIRTFVAAVLICTVAISSSGCLFLRIIRNRLPAPHPVEGGILFQYEAPSAKYVNLAGNFNSWCGTEGSGRFDPTIDPMTDEDGDGIWTIIKPLRPGRYQYKFVIDREARWELDPSNPDTDQEGGFTNSLIIVK
jgi:1,4-alpha-glucan branching enzyme